MVKRWLRSRKLPTTMLQLLPKHGVIVADVAVAFLYQTDSRIAYVDGFMSNPEATLDARVDAFDEIAIALDELGRRLGFSHLWVFTRRDGVVALGRRHGFETDDHHYRFIGKELR